MVADGVLTITLDRPERKNALDEAGFAGLAEALALAESGDVRVVVLTGAGTDFCAGADISGSPREPHPYRRMRRHRDVALALHELPVPTVAKVRGVAVGAGWNLALGCDMVAADRTARFSQIFVRRGLSPDYGGSWLLPRIVGLQQAKRLSLLGDLIDAAEAEQLGLVTWLTEPEQLDDLVAGVVARLAAGPPVAMALTKRLLQDNGARSLADALESEGLAQVVNLGGTDPAAARQAFQARREPVFGGRWR